MSQNAVKVTASGVAEVVASSKIPRLRDDYLLVKTKAVALNPADYFAKFLGSPGVTLGCDWSGVVVEVGKSATGFSIGEEVFGVCHGGNNLEQEDGAFAEIITAKSTAVIHKPQHLSFEEAATLGVGVATAGQILYHVWGLPFPSTAGIVENNRGAILIYGGSAASGTILIQLAKLSGFVVYTALSASNFELVKSRGADHIFDYNDPGFEAQINEQLIKEGHSFKYVVDTIGSVESSTACAHLIAREDSHYHSVKVPVPEVFKSIRTEESVRAGTAFAYTLLGNPVLIPGFPTIPADPSQAEWAEKWLRIAESLIQARMLKPHPPEVLTGGLAAIPSGLESFAQGGSRGKKIVFSIPQ